VNSSARDVNFTDRSKERSRKGDAFQAGGQLVTVDRSAMRMESEVMDRKKFEVEMDRLKADTMKLVAEAAKFYAESGKCRRETLYYPFFAGVAATSALTAAALALFKIFFL
jgi:hypothetical protein